MLPVAPFLFGNSRQPLRGRCPITTRQTWDSILMKLLGSFLGSDSVGNDDRFCFGFRPSRPPRLQYHPSWLWGSPSRLWGPLACILCPASWLRGPPSWFQAPPRQLRGPPLPAVSKPLSTGSKALPAGSNPLPASSEPLPFGSKAFLAASKTHFSNRHRPLRGCCLITTKKLVRQREPSDHETLLRLFS